MARGRVDVGEGEARVGARRSKVALLGRTRVVVGEAVDPNHLVTPRQQPLRQVRADEAGGAGDNHPHGIVNSRRDLSCDLMTRFESWLAESGAGVTVRQVPQGNRTPGDAARAVGSE